MARILGADGQPMKRARRFRGDPPPTAEGSSNSSQGVQLDKTVAWLKDEIDTHERLFEKFLRRGRKILKRYRDVRTPREDNVTRYNILWSNTQTRLPALYARNPKPSVERRYKDRDPIGRTAAEVLERSIEYTLEHCNDLFYTMRLVVLDYELPGLGCVWVRYEPHFHKQKLPGADEEAEDLQDGSPDEPAKPERLEGSADSSDSPKEADTLPIAADGTDSTNDVPDQVEEESLQYEEAVIDYSSWEDTGWSWARTWEEVRLLWRRVYLDRDELRERFTKLTDEEIDQIPLDWSPKKLDDSQIRITRKKAIVYEIWDKQKRRRHWIVKNYPKQLDERGDDLGLSKFFPCPRPLMANTLSDDLMPTPNYAFYQDQAREIDELSTRIVSISKALKVAGVRDTSAEGLDRLLSEGVENELVPVDGWAALKEKGGLKGVMELLPLEEIAQAIGYLRDQRQQMIEDVYQLTGIADIVRGFSNPEETATAQQMKGQFSMLRIQDQQYEVQRFCRDIVRIVGEIIAGYSLETLKQISGVKLLTNAEKQELQAQIAQAQALQAQQAAIAQQIQQHAQQPPGAPPGQPMQPQGQPGGAPALGGPAATPDQRERVVRAVEAALEHFKRPKQVRRDATGRIMELA